MVSKVVILLEETSSSSANNRSSSKHLQQQQQKQVMNCNKGKASKFKRSYCFSGDQEDGALSAILLLACIVCSPVSSFSK
ncbi:hypothetical protein BVC80_1065g16 [Macleaya cordata]|uniref:Uncharacterized protein n=1 Tax=Macleaya cordata TaxID=56857 RepID=A0A200RCR5_MACCD|nr:hypothetical protein BVC80_1065g16 [Macleaya cordata]